MDRRAAVRDLPLGSVAGKQHGVVCKPYDRAFAQHAFGGIFSGLAGVGVDDGKYFGDGPAESLGGIPAGELRRYGVHELDTAGGVGGDHGVANALEGGAKTGLAGAKLFLGGVEFPQRTLHPGEGQFLGNQLASEVVDEAEQVGDNGSQRLFRRKGHAAHDVASVAEGALDHQRERGGQLTDRLQFLRVQGLPPRGAPPGGPPELAADSGEKTWDTEQRAMHSPLIWLTRGMNARAVRRSSVSRLKKTKINAVPPKTMPPTANTDRTE